MIYIIHGGNLSSSRNFILGLQKKSGVESRFEAPISEISPSRLLEVCSSFDMFGNAPFVVLDISKVGRMDMSEYVEVMKKIPCEAVLIVLSSEELSPSNAFVKNSAKLEARVMVFKEISKANVFKFVDFVYSGNRKASYSELCRLMLAGADVFYVFSMLLYGLRNLSYLKFESPSLSRVPLFVKGRLKVQAEKFSEDDIKEIYRSFYQLDKDVKNGQVQQEMLVPLAIEKVFSFIL